MIQPRFKDLLLTALRDFSENGYGSEADLTEWLLKLEYALEREQPTDKETRDAIASTLRTIFARDVTRGGIAKRVPGVSRYTLDRIAPELRGELDRRIYAGVNLIKLNRASAVDKTLQRFAGWTTSVGPAGSFVTPRELRAAANEIAKPVAQVKFEKRRVAIDQGFKLSSAVAHVASVQAGAIAAIWHDRGQDDHGYDARPEHLKRSGTLFLVRDSWAMNEGLIRKGGLKYTDEIEQPAELVFCSCWYEYATSPRDIPETILTAKGREWVRS